MKEEKDVGHFPQKNVISQAFMYSLVLGPTLCIVWSAIHCLLIHLIQVSVPWQVKHLYICVKAMMAVASLHLIKSIINLTCPATANPSASKEVAIHICRQTWKAAIAVDPCLAANDAARVTQNVTAMTLTNNINPEFKKTKSDTLTNRNSVRQ